MNGGSNMAEVLFDLNEKGRAIRQLEELRAELSPTRRAPLMAALASHYMAGGDLAGVRQAASEALTQGSAIGLTSPLPGPSRPLP